MCSCSHVQINLQEHQDGSPLRKLVVAQVTKNAAYINWQSCKDDIPIEMWLDITIEFVKTHDGARHDESEAENFFVLVGGKSVEE